MPRDFVTLIRELLTVPAPSGREEQIAAVVKRHLDEMGYVHETDGAGNILTRLEGLKTEGPLCVLAAHLDEVGMVVTKIEPDGSLQVNRSGRISPHKLGERPVSIVGDTETITGALSFGSGHSDAEAGGIAWEDVRVITGLSKEALSRAGIRPGSSAVPTPQGRECLLFGDPDDPLLGAWTLDDRAGVAVLLQLLARLKETSCQPVLPTIVAFTVHEEGGCHGAKVLAHREKPEIFIAIDGCPWKPGMDLAVDERPAAWSKDALCHYDQRILTAFSRAARMAGTELQTAVLPSAASDASTVYSSGGAARAAVLGHARYNSHGYEVARLSVFARLLDTLTAFLELSEW